MLQEEGYVYLVQENTYTNHIKIGKSVVLNNRIFQIRGSLPFEIDLEALTSIKTKEMHGLERYLHMKYHEFRRKGEWFELGKWKK